MCRHRRPKPARNWAAVAGLVGLAIGCGVVGERGPTGDGGTTADGLRAEGAPADGGPRDAAAPDAAVPRDAAAGDAGPGYTEPLCDPLADLSDLAAAYNPATYRTTIQAIADRRYPIARAFIDVQTDGELGTWFFPRMTFAEVLDRFELGVHEGDHIFSFSKVMSGTYFYRVHAGLDIRAKQLTNFPRSEILARHVNADADTYDETYLVGSSGRQGFNNLLDEFNAYTHSLAAKYCTRDSIPARSMTSARDGILTMMYYVELYLKVARENHPADYTAIKADPEHIRLILSLWDRAEFFLKVTSSRPELGNRHATIRTWTYDPANLMEIRRLR